MRKHFSATVYVINIIDGEPKVLLHMHKKHHAWYGLGGHVEENEDTASAAIREAKEEAGITVKLLTSHPLIQTEYTSELVAPILVFDQNIDNDHRHIDHIFVGTTTDTPKMQEEFKWVSEGELDRLDLQPDTRYIAKEAIKYYREVSHY